VGIDSLLGGMHPCKAIAGIREQRRVVVRNRWQRDLAGFILRGRPGVLRRPIRPRTAVLARCGSPGRVF